MKIKDPLAVKQFLADRGVIKHRDIAKVLNLSSRTVSKILKRRPISFETAYKVASFIEKEVAEIAEPVN